MGAVMPTHVTKNRLDEFVDALREIGGSSGNHSLRQRLAWDEDFYWKAQGRLIEEGRVVPGRGRGGSVRLPDAQVGTSALATPAPIVTGKEKVLYAPLRAALEQKWINKFGFDDVVVKETHSRGSKDTGGTFTRPDITAAGIRRYVYLPKRLEIVTFEVKSEDAISIMGV
jgi:hypothetical protein